MPGEGLGVPAARLVTKQYVEYNKNTDDSMNSKRRRRDAKPNKRNEPVQHSTWSNSQPLGQVATWEKKEKIKKRKAAASSMRDRRRGRRAGNWISALRRRKGGI